MEEVVGYEGDARCQNGGSDFREEEEEGIRRLEELREVGDIMLS